jgi:hypothetical protein
MAYHPRLGQFAASGAQATDLPSARVMAGKAFSRFRAVMVALEHRAEKWNRFSGKSDAQTKR